MRHPSRRLTIIVLSLLYAVQVSKSSFASAQQTPLHSHDDEADHGVSHRPIRTSSPSLTISTDQTTLLDRLGRLFGSWIPTDGDMTTGEGGAGGGGFFGGDSATFAWGGSTLEVVKTQATYLTRPAAFGPRITSDEGLRGALLPISDFYQGLSHEKLHAAASTTASASVSTLVDNYGCPYRGGPGWRDQDFDDDEDDDDDHYRHSDRVTLVGGHTAKKGSKPRPPKDWIALVERGGGCAFIAKVRVAQALGATAVVVGDAPSPGYGRGPANDPGEDSDPGLSGRLVTMFAPGDTRDISVPSVFVTRPSYLDLTRLIEDVDKERGEQKKHACHAERKSHSDEMACKELLVEEGRRGGLEIVLGRDDIMWEWPLIDLAFILLLLPSFMTITTIIVHRIRLARQRRRERAPEPVVLGLPCLIWRGNGQPWEKIEGLVSSTDEGAAVAPSTTSPPLASSSSTRREQNLIDADVERGTANQVELGTVGQGREDGDAVPGPSTQMLKTTPIPAPTPTSDHAFLPPGRSYYSCDECAICLSEFVDGDKVRVLPCGHVFHLAEIDSWLLKVRKLCPICKRDITVPVPPTPPAPALHEPSASPSVPSPNTAPSAQHDVEPDESMPLLDPSSPRL